MFKYNELSDLLDGTLVKPLSKMEDGSIRCIDINGNECFYEFDDFDFDKLPEERMPSLEDQIEDVPEDVPEEKENSSTTVEDIIKEMEKDDSEYDGTDDTEPPIYDDDGNEIVVEDERFLNSSEVSDTLNFFEIKKDNKTNIKIWRDIV